jgi:hypothetical protein
LTVAGVRGPGISRRPALAATAGIMAALASGPLVLLPATLVAGAAAVGAVIVAVVLRPALAAYLLVATTPLLAGIERGSLLPILRPSEAVLAAVLAGLVARGGLSLARGGGVRMRPRPTEWALAAFVISGSVVPLLWMVARGREITPDDLFYASYLWKYAVVYVIARAAVRTEREVAACLWISMTVAAAVATIAILQALQLFGVPGLLATYWAPSEGQESLSAGRGTSTLSSSFAVADVMVINLALAAGLLSRGARRRALLTALAAIFILGAIGAGQFSGYLGLVVGVVVIGVILRRVRTIALLALPVAVAGCVVLWPVLAARFGDIDPATGLPRSWAGPDGRWSNLSTFFWPDIAADWNWLTGVRVSARVPAPEPWRDWVWIESGHSWLLWSGGVVFLAACFVFLVVAIRAVARIARRRTDAIGVAALGALTALWLNVVLMTLDVHLTLRGSADLTFTLLALAFTAPTAARGARAAPP